MARVSLLVQCAERNFFSVAFTYGILPHSPSSDFHQHICWANSPLACGLCINFRRWSLASRSFPFSTTPIVPLFVYDTPSRYQQWGEADVKHRLRAAEWGGLRNSGWEAQEFYPRGEKYDSVLAVLGRAKAKRPPSQSLNAYTKRRPTSNRQTSTRGNNSNTCRLAPT